MPSSHKFPKSHKLKNKKVIEAVFKNGKMLKSTCIQLKYHPLDAANITQIGFAVPKKHFKKATDRNLLKRRMREAYRLNRTLVASPSPYALFFIYNFAQINSYQEIEKEITLLLNKFNTHIATGS